MRDVSGNLRAQRKRQLEILVGNYEKALKNAKDDETKKNLQGLIKKAKDEIKDLK